MTSELGTADHPLRVAIIGSGPAGFYTADHLHWQRGVPHRSHQRAVRSPPFPTAKGTGDCAFESAANDDWARGGEPAHPDSRFGGHEHGWYDADDGRGNDGSRG